MNALSPSSPTIIGSWRRFGSAGPVYQVTRLAPPRVSGEAQAHIRILESGEELDYKLADILGDPLAD